MDGQEQAQRSRGDRSPRSSGPSRGPGARSAVASGSAGRTATTSRFPHGTCVPRVAPAATYRLLRVRGLDPAEAANLTAWMTGIPVREHRWRLREIQTLLFLRRLTELGRFGPGDDRSTRH